MFAFAIWDKRQRTLFLARDHLGVKPLYYYWDGTTFAFCSELKAILQHPAINREIDLNAAITLRRFASIRKWYLQAIKAMFDHGFMQWSSLHCHPTRMKAPQALMQAMLSGLACVTTPIGSITDIAHDQRTALVVPPQDAQALADAISLCLSDVMLREMLGTAASAYCMENCDAEKMLNNMEDVFF